MNLIPTSKEHRGTQRFIYRSFFALTFRITERYRILEIEFSTDYLRREEIVYLLCNFGFALRKTIECYRDKNGCLTFQQELIIFNLPAYLIPQEENVCCRYYIDDTADKLLPYITAAVQSKLEEKMVCRLARPMKVKGEIYPSDMVPVIARSNKGAVTAFPMVWGFRSPVSNTPIFNARSESAGEKPMFQDSWQAHRCVIPASYFFEWGRVPDSKDKIKYAIQPKCATAMWMAGLYRYEQAGDFTYPVFTILTRDSVGAMAEIHERMPVILPYSQIERWVDPEEKPERFVRQAVRDLVVEAV